MALNSSAWLRCWRACRAAAHAQYPSESWMCDCPLLGSRRAQREKEREIRKWRLSFWSGSVMSAQLSISLWSHRVFFKKRKKLKKHSSCAEAQLHREERDINLRADAPLTSLPGCFFTSPAQERRPQDEDVLPHHYGTIRHKLTTFGDHRNRALSVCCNHAVVLWVHKGFSVFLFGGKGEVRWCAFVFLLVSGGWAEAFALHYLASPLMAERWEAVFCTLSLYATAAITRLAVSAG